VGIGAAEALREPGRGHAWGGGRGGGVVKCRGCEHAWSLVQWLILKGKVLRHGFHRLLKHGSYWLELNWQEGARKQVSIFGQITQITDYWPSDCKSSAAKHVRKA